MSRRWYNDTDNLTYVLSLFLTQVVSVVINVNVFLQRTAIGTQYGGQRTELERPDGRDHRDGQCVSRGRVLADRLPVTGGRTVRLCRTTALIDSIHLFI